MYYYKARHLVSANICYYTDVATVTGSFYLDRASQLTSLIYEISNDVKPIVTYILILKDLPDDPKIRPKRVKNH